MGKSRKESCDFCEGKLVGRSVQVVRGRGRKLVVIEGVPALVCDRCGMRYYEASSVKGMEGILRRRKYASRTIRVPVARFQGAV